MRLGYVCADPGIPPAGTKGASVHYREMGRALRAEQVDVRGVTVRPADSADVGFPVISTGRRTKPKDELARELGSVIDQAPMLERLREAGPFDAVYERYSLFGLAGLTYAREHGLPFFLEVNAPLWEEAARYRSLEIPQLARGVARELFTHASRVLVVSQALRDLVIAEGADPRRVEYFPNGVTPAFLDRRGRFSAADPLGSGPHKKRVIVFVGSLKPWHGVDFLLDCLDGLPDDVALWIVGDGPLAEDVKAAQAMHPDRLVFDGAMPHERIPSVLQAADVAVAPYTDEAPAYFCPMKVVEAMAVGVPILAADVPAVRGVVGENEVSWFEPSSRDDFVRAVKSLLGDLHGASMAAVRNREVVLRDHTWQARARQVVGWILEANAEGQAERTA